MDGNFSAGPLFLSRLLAELLLDYEDSSGMFLRNLDILLSDYTALHRSQFILFKIIRIFGATTDSNHDLSVVKVFYILFRQWTGLRDLGRERCHGHTERPKGRNSVPNVPRLSLHRVASELS
jgi:hypothetical protein